MFASEVNAHEDQAMRERAQLDALIGEYGGGVTGERRLSSLAMQQGQDLATISDTAAKRQQEISLGTAGDLRSINSKYSTLPSVNRPSRAGLGASLASSVLTFGAKRNEINNPKPGAGTGTAQAQYDMYKTMPYLLTNRSLGD